MPSCRLHTIWFHTQDPYLNILSSTSVLLVCISREASFCLSLQGEEDQYLLPHTHLVPDLTHAALKLHFLSMSHELSTTYTEYVDFIRRELNVDFIHFQPHFRFFLCVCVCVLFHPLGYVFSSVKITLAPLLLPSYSFESILFPILDLLGICFHCLTPFGFSIKMTIKDFLGPSLRMIERRRRNCGLHGTIPQTIPVEYNRFVLFPLFFLLLSSIEWDSLWLGERFILFIWNMSNLTFVVWRAASLVDRLLAALRLKKAGGALTSGAVSSEILPQHSIANEPVTFSFNVCAVAKWAHSF